jgi:hypothetical protein
LSFRRPIRPEPKRPIPPRNTAHALVFITFPGPGDRAAAGHESVFCQIPFNNQ